jgi:copper chaperone CopZ
MKLKFCFTVVLIALSSTAWSGIKWIDVGVNGLTCSMCSRSVEMSLRRLDFVDSVAMSLEKTEGRIYFESNALINLQQIAKAIVNAGFSVRFVRIEFTFDDIPLNNDGSFVFQGQTFEWLDFKNKTREASLKLVDDNFLPKKEVAEWKKKLTTSDSGKKTLHVIKEG